jgi:hypothetical protein
VHHSKGSALMSQMGQSLHVDKRATQRDVRFTSNSVQTFATQRMTRCVPIAFNAPQVEARPARNKNGSEDGKASKQAQRDPSVAETFKADATTLSE